MDGLLPSDLASLEMIIEEGKAAFLRVGAALMEIKERRLYKAAYGTFENYCQTRWEFTRKHAYDLIRAKQGTENLLPMGNNISFSAAQELGRIEDESTRAIVYGIAVSAFKTPEFLTAPIIRSTINALRTAQETHGFVDPGEGHMTAIAAAVIGEEYERKQRQADHIRSHQKPAIFNEVGAADELLPKLKDRLVALGENNTVRIIVYEAESNYGTPIG
jgi:hypothetical protein